MLCDPEASQTLAEHLAATAKAQKKPRVLTVALSLLIGPEGGWSSEEQALAATHSVTRIKFGLRVLRTETAGIALVSAATALLGW